MDIDSSLKLKYVTWYIFTMWGENNRRISERFISFGIDDSKNIVNYSKIIKHGEKQIAKFSEDERIQIRNWVISLRFKHTAANKILYNCLWLDCPHIMREVSNEWNKKTAKFFEERSKCFVKWSKTTSSEIRQQTSHLGGGFYEADKWLPEGW